MGHPSAHSLSQMATTFQPQMTLPPRVPVVGRVAGPVATDPLPFDGSAPMYGELTSTYPQVNEQPRPMSNLPQWQVPVMPFSKSKDTSPYDTNRSPLQLFQNQGYDQDSWRPKREQAPMFAPQQQNIFGMPAQAQVQRNRYEPSLELKHQKPFEAEWSLRSGGFHPTKRILPTNVPVLRQQLLSTRVEGPTHATSHPSGLFGTNRGELGLVEKRKYDMSGYEKVPFPTSAPNQAAPKYAPAVCKPTSRQTSSRPYGGTAEATGPSATYVKGKYFIAPQALPSQLHARWQQAGGPNLVGGNATTAHFMDKARTTIGEGTEMATMEGAVRAPVASGTAHPMDVARPTMLEFSEQQVRDASLNGTYMAPTTHFMDTARPTMLEGTEHMVRSSAVNGASYAPSTYLMDPARATMLEATEAQVRANALNGVMYAPQTYQMDPARATMLEGTEQMVRPSGLNGMQFAPQTYQMDPARATMLEGTELNSQTGAPTVSGGGARTYYMDEARATLLEGTEAQVRQSAMSTYTGPTMQFMDSARATLLEGTESQTSVSNANFAAAPMTYLMDAARATLKQWTSDHSYEGGAGTSELQAPMQSVDLMRNAHLNDKLEAAMDVQRAPAMGGNVDVEMGNRDRIGFGDARTVRVRPDFLPNNYGGLVDRTGESNERWIPTSTVADTKAVEESWTNQRNAPYVLTGLAGNPFAQPMWNQAQ